MILPPEGDGDGQALTFGEEGKVVGRFPSKVEPESSEMVQAIEKALAEKS